MDTVTWTTLLFVLKWVFIGLVYIVLTLVIITVRSEMAQRVEDHRRTPTSAPGRLMVVAPGADPRFQPGEFLPLQPLTSVGADPQNDIVLSDPYISRRHARLRWDGATWWVEDLGSRNGTLVNGVPCQPHSPQQAPAGARINFGDAAFEIIA